MHLVISLCKDKMTWLWLKHPEVWQLLGALHYTMAFVEIPNIAHGMHAGACLAEAQTLDTLKDIISLLHKVEMCLIHRTKVSCLFLLLPMCYFLFKYFSLQSFLFFAPIFISILSLSSQVRWRMMLTGSRAQHR